MHSMIAIVIGHQIFPISKCVVLLLAINDFKIETEISSKTEKLGFTSISLVSVSAAIFNRN